MLRYFILIAFLLLPPPANATQEPPDTPRAALERLEYCANPGFNAMCRTQVTGDSQGLYNRLAAQELIQCLPDDLYYISDEQAGEYRIVRGYTEILGFRRYFRLWFAQENEAWKLDLPTTLHAGLGKHWQQQVGNGEQVYRMMKQQFGSDMGCNAIYELVGTQAPARR